MVTSLNHSWLSHGRSCVNEYVWIDGPANWRALDRVQAESDVAHTSREVCPRDSRSRKCDRRRQMLKKQHTSDAGLTVGVGSVVSVIPRENKGVGR